MTELVLPEYAERFFAKVRKTPGCWEWKAGYFDKGYGAFRLGGKLRKAHRVSWEMHNGEIPEGLKVLHECDNPKCVRPEHLFLGTDQDNADDRAAKGRTAIGAACHKTKLTPENVREMRRLRVREGVPFYKLGERFGVSAPTAQRAISGLSWRHL